jgi:hypothetical protein
MTLGALRNRERGQFKKSLILARPEPAPLAIEPPKWEFLKGREPAVSVERDSRALRGLCSLGFGALLLFGIIKVLWPGGDPNEDQKRFRKSKKKPTAQLDETSEVLNTWNFEFLLNKLKSVFDLFKIEKGLPTTMRSDI